MFPIIIIETFSKNYNQIDVIKEINNNYNFYFNKVNQSLDSIVYNNYKFKDQFKYQDINMWYANNLSERNIQKGNLINYLLILEFLKNKIKKKIKIISVKTDSKVLVNSLKKLNIESFLIRSKFNLSIIKKNLFFVRTLSFLLKLIVKSILIKNSKSLKSSLSKSNKIFFTPFESKKNIYLASLSKFNDKIEKLTNSKITHIQYLSDMNHKYKKIIPKKNKVNFNKENIFVIFELINFIEVLFCFFIYVKFYFISNKFLKELSFFLKDKKKQYLFFAIHEETMESFKGPILLQNIFYIYIFNKIKRYSLSNSKIFFNFENQYWEKILLQVFRNNTFCKYGVLDTPPKLWDSTLYLKNIKFNNELFPNYILYSCPIYTKLVNSKNSFINKKLILIESLRYKKNFSSKRNLNKNILIFGDGNKYSHKLLINKVKNLILNYKYSLHLREHPSCNNYSQGIKLSSNNLDVDLKKFSYFIIPNSSNSYLDIMLFNKIPFVFLSKESISKSIFKIINLNHLIFKNENELITCINNLDKKNYKISINKIIENIILINNSFFLFEKFVKSHLIDV